MKHVLHCNCPCDHPYSEHLVRVTVLICSCNKLFAKLQCLNVSSFGL